MTVRKLVLVLAIVVAVYQIALHAGLIPGHAAPRSARIEAPQSAPPASRTDESSGDRSSAEGSSAERSAGHDTADAPKNAPAPRDTLADAYAHHRSNMQVEGSGTIERVLSDDTNGSRHQRFIVRLPSGQTVLVAHNIDLAPRVDSLHEGDPISFAGEYEWNAEGGVIHWTHRDPQGTHPAGWLKHDGHTYQ